MRSMFATAGPAFLVSVAAIAELLSPTTAALAADAPLVPGATLAHVMLEPAPRDPSEIRGPATIAGTFLRQRVMVSSFRLTDNGDNDGFADPNETVNLYVTLKNLSGGDRTRIVVGISTVDPDVDCISAPVLAFGDMTAGETRESATAVTLRVADVARASVDADLSVKFDVTVTGDGFDAPHQQLTLDMDLNVSGGLLLTTYTEGFEAAGFGSFTSMALDVGRASLALSDGHRCQYNDPDFANSNSYGNTFCFLPDGGYDWHVHDLSSPDGGRAYVGNNSLHWGMHPGAPSGDTTRLRQLDAIRTTNPVNLGWNGVTSELSFKHQVGLVDTDYVSGPFGFAEDRGIVQVQLATSAGQAVGGWRKISPYENVYAFVADDRFSNCLFDPTDDGNVEDDYFYPTDPNRRLGPSSTCAPEFVFSREGSIFWSSTFDPADIPRSTDGPGLQGSRGPGTWVETKFSLDRWRGRRMRFRFLTTSMEVADATTWQQAVAWNPIPADDGWYIDDIRVTNTVAPAATVTIDTADRSGLPACACQPSDPPLFTQMVGFSDRITVAWPTLAMVDVLRGDLMALRASGGQFVGTVDLCFHDHTLDSVSLGGAPNPGGGWYYLVRGAGPAPPCSPGYSWRTGDLAEQPGAGGDRDADLAQAPNTCPP